MVSYSVQTGMVGFVSQSDLSSSESNTDSVITSLPLAKSRTSRINALDVNAWWEFTLKLITLSSERCDVSPHCNVM